MNSICKECELPSEQMTASCLHKKLICDKCLEKCEYCHKCRSIMCSFCSRFYCNVCNYPFCFNCGEHGCQYKKDVILHYVDK